MKSKLQQVQPPELEEPIKHLKLNTFLEEIDGLRYFYFMAEKRNNSGTLFNLRFFILMGDDLLGYATSYDPSIKLPLRSRAKIPTLKTSIRVKDLTHCDPVDSRTVVIKFANDEAEVTAPPYWILKFANVDAAQSVLKQVQEARNSHALKTRGKSGMYDGPNSISQFKKAVEAGWEMGSPPPRRTQQLKLNAIQQKHPPIQNPQKSIPSASKLSVASTQNTPLKQIIHLTQQQHLDQIETIRKQHTNRVKQSLQPNMYQKIPYEWLEKIRGTSYLEALKEFNSMSCNVIRDLVDKGNINEKFQEYPEYGLVIQFESMKNNYILEQQFENYKYLLSKTNNQKRMKIPLISLINYRGFSALVKLRIPGNQIDPEQKTLIIQQMEEICQIKSSEMNISLVILNIQPSEHQRYSHLQQNPYVTNLPKLLPIDPYLKSPYCLSSPLKDQLEQVIKHQQSNIHKLSQKLSSGEQSIYRFDEFVSLLNSYGLNRQYIPALIEKSDSKFVRMQLICYLVAYEQSAKLLEQNPNLQKTLRIVNEIIDSNGGDRIRLLRKKLNFNEKQTIRGMLIQSFIYFCGLQVNYQLIGLQILKSKSQIFKIGENVFGFKPRISDIRLFSNGMWQKVKETLEARQQQKDFEQIIKLLNLSHEPKQIIDWPSDYLHNKLLSFLANFTAPQELQQSTQPFSSALYHLVEGPELKPSVRVWKLALAKIKWLFMGKIIEPAKQLCEKLLESIDSWSDGKHPILCETLITIARYSASVNNYQEACQYFEHCLEILKQIYPLDYQQLANTHNQAALAYQKSRNYELAASHYKKVAYYLESLDLDKSSTFAEVKYRLSLMQFCAGDYEQAKESVLLAVQIYYDNNEQNQSEVVDCYDLLARIAELSDPELYENICNNCGQGLGELKNQQNVEKMMRIVLLPLLRTILDQKEKESLCQLLEQLPISKKGYPRGYSYIRNLTSANKFLPNLTLYLKNYSHLYRQIVQTNGIQTWQGLDQSSSNQSNSIQFLCLMEALLYVLGLNYLQGALTE